MALNLGSLESGQHFKPNLLYYNLECKTSGRRIDIALEAHTSSYIP